MRCSLLLLSCFYRHILSLEAAERSSVVTLKGHNGTVRALQFQPTSGSATSMLASGGAGDGIVRLWDISGGTDCLSSPS